MRSDSVICPNEGSHANCDVASNVGTGREERGVYSNGEVHAGCNGMLRLWTTE